jgi:hypothetical protein
MWTRDRAIIGVLSRDCSVFYSPARQMARESRDTCMENKTISKWKIYYLISFANLQHVRKVLRTQIHVKAFENYCHFLRC